MKTSILLVSILFSNVGWALSQNEALDFTIHQHYISPRAMGMGNAFTAVADDYSAMFYNPAGLVRIDENTINLGVGAMIDKDVLKLKNDIESTQKSSGTDQINQIASLLQQNYGKHYSLRLPTTGAFWVRKSWGIALLPTDLNIEMEIHNVGTPTLDVVATQDTTLAFTYSHAFKGMGADKFSMGLTTKAIYRGYVNRSFLALDLALDPKLFRPEDANEGMTVDGDIGFMYTPDIKQTGWFSFMRFLRPTYGFTVRNVVDYGFPTNMHFIDPNTGKPAKLQRRFDLGTKWELPDFWIFKTRFAFDMRDMGHRNWTFRKGLHAGFEFLWKVFSWWRGGWRAGINQGYVSAGFTGELGIFKLDLLTYGEEVGPSDQKKENRRYALNASLEW